MVRLLSEQDNLLPAPGSIDFFSVFLLSTREDLLHDAQDDQLLLGSGGGSMIGDR